MEKLRELIKAHLSLLTEKQLRIIYQLIRKMTRG